MPYNKVPKTVGQPCPDCGVPFIQGAKGAYCKPCYIKWANEKKAAEQNVPFITPTESAKKDDKKWEEISRGKVRHGFAIEAFKMGKMLSLPTVAEINAWTDYVMTGKLPKIASDEEYLPNFLEE